MKIIQHNVRSFRSYPKSITCRFCGSVLEVEEQDVTKGTVVYSPVVKDFSATGVECPCCYQFTPMS